MLELRTILDFVWKQRLLLRAEADELRAKADELWAEAEGQRAKAEGQRAKAEGLRAKADELWAEAVLTLCGDITLRWILRPEKNDHMCELGNGEIFEP